MCFFFKPKTAYELRISDWSSDVCSSDLEVLAHAGDFVLRRSRSRSAQAIPCTISRMQKAGIRDFSRKEAGIRPTEMEPSSTAQELRTDGQVAQANSRMEGSRKTRERPKIGRAHVGTPVTNANIDSRLLLETKN